MAGDWLKIEKDTPEKPEMMAIADILGVSLGDALLACFRVWRWADTHSTDGTFPGLGAAAIDAVARTPGLADAMTTVGWLTVQGGGVTVPLFDRHMGRSAKARVYTAERQRQFRSRHSGNAGVTRLSRASRVPIPRPLRRSVYERDNHTCVFCGFEAGTRACAGDYVGVVLSVDHVVPVTQGGATTSENLVACCTLCNNRKNNRTPQEAGMVARFVTPACDAAVTPALPRCDAAVTPALPNALPEKRREEKKNTPLPPKGEVLPTPKELDTEAFRAAWADWVQHRKEIRHALKPTTVQAQLKKLAGWGEARALAAIRHSIEQGYEGLYEPHPGRNGQAAAPAPAETTQERHARIARESADRRARDYVSPAEQAAAVTLFQQKARAHGRNGAGPAGPGDARGAEAPDPGRDDREPRGGGPP